VTSNHANGDAWHMTTTGTRADPPFGASVTVHLVTVVVTPNWDFCAACDWQGVVTVQATADDAIHRLRQ
jgi:hypothetical protein